ncbi:MAG: protease HtpX [Woeseiaceae bacterium]|nr:protease HtpX [Woeseiaceae bacterium]
MLKRVALFIATNIAIIVVLSIVLRLLGVDQILNERGGINFEALLVLSLVVGFGGSFISLAMSKWMAKRATGAQVITEPRNAAESWLFTTVQNQARLAGIDMPEIAVYDSPDMNAFATGMRRNASLVAVSTGLLQNMSKEEVEAVLAHEISHVANGDMITLALVQGVVNTFVVFAARIVGHLVDRAVFRSDGYGPGYFISTIVAQIVFGILATPIVMWVSRQREFRADAGSAQLVGRQPMINALQRLQQNIPSQLPKEMKAFGISGEKANGLARLFMSHPPIEERIAALQKIG